MTSDSAIVAQASAQGVARRGIIRLSGKNILNAVGTVFFKGEKTNGLLQASNINDKTTDPLLEDSSKTAIVEGWLAPWGKNAPELFVPCALFYWPQGRGFTGEQSLELHLTGSPAILDAAVRAICETKTARLATRGEFTLRAFLSGRIDLTQAEAVLGALDANSDAELQVALVQLSGSLSREFTVLREKLLDVLVDLEAGFDFVDEDIEFVARNEIRTRLEETKAQVEKALKRAKTQIGSDRIPVVVLIGPPNAGKSSLFNKTIERFGGGDSGKAIVSDQAGTTRDYLEKEINVDGIRFILVDSAGIESEQTLEEDAKNSPRVLAQQGLRRLFSNAAIVIRCIDPTSKDESTKLSIEELVPSGAPVIDVITKQDLCNDDKKRSSSILSTSSVTGVGIKELGKRIADMLREDSQNGEMTTSTAVRCQEALREASESLQNALDVLNDDFLHDDFILASEIRVALDRIGIVTGQVHTEDLLDRIFSRFCIGK